MHPILFQLGPFKLPAYGAMVAAGYLAGIWYVFRRARGSGLDKDALSDMVFYSVLGGMAGAKLLYLATYWNTFGYGFGDKLWYALRTFQYGFVFYGGFIGGATAFLFAARRRKLPALRVADLFSPALALGHAFGRLGCFLAGCCHGSPSACALAVTFTDPSSEVAPHLLGVPLHPAQLYEASGNLFIFFILDRALPRSLKGGQPGGLTACLYAGLYSAQRFLLEFLRGDDRGGQFLGLSPGQQVSAALFAAAAAGFIIIRRKHENDKA